jgi:hypothetical protein
MLIGVLIKDKVNAKLVFDEIPQHSFVPLIETIEELMLFQIKSGNIFD